jgi:hypothetical protein
MGYYSNKEKAVEALLIIVGLLGGIAVCCAVLTIAKGVLGLFGIDIDL